jgi:hypothetical protein
MIERATLNKVIKDIDKFKTASAMFKEKYFDLPGDLKDATQYWGTAADCAVAQADGTTLTCNGNGDGYVSYYAASVGHESAHFMRQLGNAGLLEGAYSGQWTDLPNDKSSPKGPMTGSYWVAWSLNNVTKIFQGRAVNQNANRIVLGIPSNMNGQWWSASLSAANQYHIDRKIDDGLPYQGKIVDMSGTTAGYTLNCASINSDEFNSSPPGTTSINAVYRVERAGPSALNAEGCLLIVDLE